MAVLLSYCLKLSLSLAFVSVFYHLVLKKLTFYNWNRYYLLGYSLLSLVVPFVDISPVLERKDWNTIHFVQWVPILDSNAGAISANVGRFFTGSNVVGLLLITGVFLMGLRLLFQFVSFKRLTKQAEIMSVEGIRFYQVNNSIIPFSFGNSIFVNRRQHTDQELKEIIRHEFVHVKQKHSIDILWAEFLCMLNWYNPFAWLLKASIRQNLEFIADNQVLDSGINRKQYQYLLLKVVGDNQFSVTSKFNFSSLKKRIAMMNRSKSSRLNLVRFLFILPIVIMSLLAFRNKRTKILLPGKNALIGILVDKKARTDTIPKSSKSPAQAGNANMISTISDDLEITDDRAVIHLKNGTTEEYDLKNKEQRKKFEDKYGKIGSTSVHKGPMTTVSVVTPDGVGTTVAPVAVTVDQPSAKVITAGSGKGVGNGSGSRCVTVNSSVSAVTTVTTPNENTVAVKADVPLAMAVVAANSSQTAVAIGGEDGNLIAIAPEVLFTITRNTTQQQLDELKKQMKEKGYDLDFKDVKFNDGKLVSISGTIQSVDASGVFVAVSFSKLVVSVIKDGSRIHFRVDEMKKQVI